MPFTKGQARSGRAGRGKGTLNKVTHEAREFARKFLDSEDYRKSLERRILLDELPGGVEVMLWHYAFGKPTDKVEVNFPSHAELQDMSPEELAAEAQRISLAILERRDKSLADSNL